MSNSELTQLSDVIGLIYEGATDPSRWTKDILPTVAEYLQAPKCVLFTPLKMPQDGGFGYIHGLSQRQFDLYVNRYQAEDIVTQTGIAKGLAFEGNVMLDPDVMPREQLLDSKYYKEYLVREDLAQMMIAIVFGQNSASGAPVAGCTFFRGHKAPLFTDRDRDRLNLLVPHLSRSLGVMQRIRSAELTVASSLAALDRLSTGVLLTDSSGAVAFTNRSGQRMLDDRDGLRLRKLTNGTGLGDLVADNAKTSKSIGDAISATLNRDPYATPHFSSCVSVPRTSGVASYTLQFSALGRHNEFGAYAAIIFIADGAQEVEIDPALLQSAYGLTPAEARVAAALLESGSAQEVADALGTSPNTVHTQIKQIYAKLGVDTRARFVKLLLGLATHRS